MVDFLPQPWQAVYSDHSMQLILSMVDCLHQPWQAAYSDHGRQLILTMAGSLFWLWQAAYSNHGRQPILTMAGSLFCHGYSRQPTFTMTYSTLWPSVHILCLHESGRLDMYVWVSRQIHDTQKIRLCPRSSGRRKSGYPYTTSHTLFSRASYSHRCMQCKYTAT